MVVNWIQAAILGALQGLTEFLPVSSSGHLRIGEWMMGSKLPDHSVFEVYLHGVTLLVVLFVFRERIKGLFKDRPQLVAIGLSAVATVVLVKGLKIDEAYKEVALIYVFVAELATGLFLLLGEKFARQNSEERCALWQAALIIGLAQGVAVLPGVSRSGATIVCALILGWKREKAFDFAFLMSIPVIGGAMLLGAKDVIESGDSLMLSWKLLVAGAVPAAILGYLTLVGLRKWVQTSLNPFAYYCIALGAVGVWLV